MNVSFYDKISIVHIFIYTHAVEQYNIHVCFFCQHIHVFLIFTNRCVSVYIQYSISSWKTMKRGSHLILCNKMRGDLSIPVIRKFKFFSGTIYLFFQQKITQSLKIYSKFHRIVNCIL